MFVYFGLKLIVILLLYLEQKRQLLYFSYLSYQMIMHIVKILLQLHMYKKALVIKLIQYPVLNMQ